SDGLEATVVVKNPCKFPIEFYSLDFDEQYLEEEKILRIAVGSGSEYSKTFLMPSRAVGETLPPEVLEEYEAHKKRKAQRAEIKAMTEARAKAEAEAKAMGPDAPAYRRTVAFYPEPVVKVTDNPISRAVMRHRGVDPSLERPKARQQRGIVIIIHGAPRAGKSDIAASLCYYYDADYLRIDTVVIEAITNG
ncbi:HYDIN protein, partial [Pachycephala philippinensis]|nr:HYDIN protein [Pachycephala philippinensis]